MNRVNGRRSPVPASLRAVAGEIGRSAILVAITTSAVFLILDAVHGRGRQRSDPVPGSEQVLEEQLPVTPGQLRTDSGSLRLLSWWQGAVRGEFGRSQSYPGRNSVRVVLVSSATKTLRLVIGAIALSLGVSAMVGLSLAWGMASPWSRISRSILAGLAVIPSFVLCLAIFYLFVHWGREPVLTTAIDRSYGWWLRALISVLPVVTLALSDGSIPELVSTIRRESLETRDRAYFLFRELRGQGRLVLLLQSVGTPVLGVLEGRFVHLLGTTVVVEQVFNVHGLGYAAWEAIRLQDTVVILGVTLFLGILISLLRIAARTLRSLLDPRDLRVLTQ